MRYDWSDISSESVSGVVFTVILWNTGFECRKTESFSSMHETSGFGIPSAPQESRSKRAVFLFWTFTLTFTFTFFYEVTARCISGQSKSKRKSYPEGRYYVGQTNDLQARLHYHNSGYNPSTKSMCPCRLVAYIAVSVRGDAMRLERYIKRKH